MTLLLIWGTKNPNLLISEIDFVVLTFLFISLSFLASLCLEDMMHLSVPVKTLFLAIFFLIGLHFFRLWQEYHIILNDYIISACCALCIWIISKLFSMITGRSSLGGADTPLIFALSLGMTINGITLWVILFCGMPLIKQILIKVILNQKNALLKPIPLIPYLVGATAFINLLT